MMLTELAHFNDEGWGILADVIDSDDGFVYKFYSVEFFNGKPRKFYTPKKNIGPNPPDKCQLRYFEKEDISNLSKGDNVFYMIGAKVDYGKITSINFDTWNAVIDHKITVKIFTILVFEHNFEQIENTDAYICSHCRALHTSKNFNIA